MSAISNIRTLRGVVLLSTDDNQSLRIRASDFKKHAVEIGDEIDWETYTDRLAAAQFSAAYEAALNALDFCAKTRKELERALIMKGFVPQCVDTVLNRLEEIHLLDDSALAQRYAENAANKPIGIYAVKRKLRSKGISEEDTESALDCMTEAQQIAAAKKAGEKLMRKYVSLPSREGRAKLSQALARRGFSWDIVQSAVEDLFEEDSEY